MKMLAQKYLKLILDHKTHHTNFKKLLTMILSLLESLYIPR